MSLHTLSKYLKYILFSSHKRGHGIHSPFIFNLVNKVFRNKIDTEVVNNIERIRQRMISDRRKISVSDYGSGSEKTKSNLRKVSDIAKNSAVPPKYGILLNRLSGEFGECDIIELGSSFGISTMYLASASPQAMVHTIEGCPEISALAKSNFERSGLKNIRLYTGRFKEMLPEIENQKVNPGLIFIDGDHRKEPVLDNFYKLAGMSDNKCVIILDDIHSSVQMTEAWEEIKKFERVTATVDIFRMGLVFFREGMSRTDYIIRY